MHTRKYLMLIRYALFELIIIILSVRPVVSCKIKIINVFFFSTTCSRASCTARLICMPRGGEILRKHQFYMFAPSVRFLAFVSFPVDRFKRCTKRTHSRSKCLLFTNNKQQLKNPLSQQIAECSMQINLVQSLVGLEFIFLVRFF